MEVKATAKFIHMAPRKTRLVVSLIRGMQVDAARRQLMFSSKSAAKPVLKVLNSAVANATNNQGMSAESLTVSQAFVDEGPTIFRYMPRAQGRATPIRKRMSHITVVLEGTTLAPKKAATSKNVEEKNADTEKPVAKPKAKKTQTTKTK